LILTFSDLLMQRNQHAVYAKLLQDTASVLDQSSLRLISVV